MTFTTAGAILLAVDAVQIHYISHFISYFIVV